MSEPAPYILAPSPCLNHPDTAAAGSCDRCRQSFCADCVVPIQSQTLCGRCKGALLRHLQRVTGTQDRQAQDAFNYSLVGILLCGPILHPVAISKAVSSLRRHGSDRAWPDRWKAIAAIWIAAIMLTVQILYLGFVLVGLGAAAGLASLGR